MVDMARSPEDKVKEAPMGMLCSIDTVDYDYGLQGSFNKESLNKLDLDSDVHVGDYLHIVSFAKVTGVHMKPGSDEIDRVDWCLCHIAVDESLEGDEEE